MFRGELVNMSFFSLLSCSLFPDWLHSKKFLVTRIWFIFLVFVVFSSWQLVSFACIGITLPPSHILYRSLSLSWFFDDRSHNVLIISVSPFLMFCNPSPIPCYMPIEKKIIHWEVDRYRAFKKDGKVIGLNQVSWQPGGLSFSRSVDLNWIAVMCWIKVALKCMK